MNIKLIYFIFQSKRWVSSFALSLLVHFLLFLFLINYLIVGKHVPELSNVDFKFHLMDNANKLAQGPNRPLESTKDETVSQHLQPHPSDVPQKSLAEGALSPSSAPLPSASPSSAGGGFFTRHLHRPIYPDSRHSAVHPVENEQQKIYRLAVFSSQISQVAELDCVLLTERVECHNGYAMSMEQQIEWRYLFANGLLPNKIKTNNLSK